MTSSLLDKRAVRFLLVGVLNSAFGLGVFSGVVWMGQGTLTALLAGNAAGLIFNFLTTGGLVFRTLALHRLSRFAACYGSTLLVNYGLLAVISPVVTNKIVAQAILTLPMAAFSYAVMSLWVFRPATEKHAAAHLEGSSK
jgi:putative flippase GtrA